MVNRKETNLDGVKAMARTLLYTDINKTAYEDLGYNVGQISMIAGEAIDGIIPKEGTAAAQELAADIMGIKLAFDIDSASGYVLSTQLE